MADTREYTFDMKLYASIRVEAASEEEAKRLIDAHMHCAESNFGAWPNGDPILGEVSINGEPALLEVDGEAI
jgi:hypothetical protein